MLRRWPGRRLSPPSARSRDMKDDIHPDYRPVIFKDKSADFAILTRSTIKTNEKLKWDDGIEYPVVYVDISSASHPFYTRWAAWKSSARSSARSTRRRRPSPRRKRKSRVRGTHSGCFSPGGSQPAFGQASRVAGSGGYLPRHCPSLLSVDLVHLFRRVPIRDLIENAEVQVRKEPVATG
jgi:large subunit ribosomal protein L31